MLITSCGEVAVRGLMTLAALVLALVSAPVEVSARRLSSEQIMGMIERMNDRCIRFDGSEAPQYSIPLAQLEGLSHEEIDALLDSYEQQYGPSMLDRMLEALESIAFGSGSEDSAC